MKYLEARGDTSRKGKVVLLLTVDKNKTPHVTLLSLWEVLAKNRREILTATYPDSSTTKNIHDNGGGTLVVVDKGMTYYVKGSITPLRMVGKSEAQIAISLLTVSQVLEDKMAGANIDTGVTFSEKVEHKQHKLAMRGLLKASR